MGGSASRELEAAQAQVRRLTADLQRAQAGLKAQGSANTLVAAAADKQKALQAKLSKTEAELSSTVKQLHSINSEVPKFKREVAAAKEELVAVRRADQEKSTQLSALQQELRMSKDELEQIFGRLKFAEQESAAVAKLRADLTEERRTLAEQQKAAAAASVRLVAEASAALVDAERPHSPHIHPVGA